MSLITVQEVKDHTSIEPNVSDDLIYPSIEIAEINHLMPVLGQTLYDEIIATPSGHTALLEKIKRPLSFWVYYESALFLWMRMTNKGLVKRTSEHAETVSSEDFKYYRGEIREYAKEYTAVLIKYLRETNQGPYSATESDKAANELNEDNITGIFFY